MVERSSKRRKVGGGPGGSSRASSSSSSSSSSSVSGGCSATVGSSLLLSVAATAAGHLVGKGGSSITEIRRTSGAEIDVAKPGEEPSGRASRIVGPAPRDGETLIEVLITGSAEAVRAAERLVSAAASRTGRRRKLPAEGDAGELADIFEHQDDCAFQQPATVGNDGTYPSTDGQYGPSTGLQQPLVAEASVGAVETSSGDLPSGWARGWDPERDQVYYWHAATRTSTWTLPSPQPNSPRQSASAVTASSSTTEAAGSSSAVSLAAMVDGYGSSSEEEQE